MRGAVLVVAVMLVTALAAGCGVGVLGSLGIGLWANGAVRARSRGAIYDTAAQVSPRPVAIVFGARVWGDAPSDILADRLGTVKKLLLSGDHGRHEYDEVNAMREHVVGHGVPPEARLDCLETLVHTVRNFR